jgi:hypothetical protein
VVTGEGRSSEPVRRSRRAVRQAGTVGGDDVQLVSVLPAVTPEVPAGRAGTPDGAAKPARPGGPTSSLDRSADDTDVGWGERESGSNDDRLTTDKPPHW